MNKVILIGRLGKDPDMKYLQTGTPVCNLRIATDESYTDKDGNKVDKAEWHSIVCYQRQAENCKAYLAKGSLVAVEGSLQTRKWQDQQGQDRYTTEIKAQQVKFLSRAGQGDNQQNGAPQKGNSNGRPQQSGQNRQSAPQRNGGSQGEFDDYAFPAEYSGMDDVPF